MTINERLELLISTLKQNNNSFSHSIGVNSTIIHNIVKGRNAPSYDILNKIALSYDNINMNWLISERGEILINSDSNNVDTVKDFISMHRHKPASCEKCKAKDLLIESLTREIETQSQYLSLLKQITPQTQR